MTTLVFLRDSVKKSEGREARKEAYNAGNRSTESNNLVEAITMKNRVNSEKKTGHVK